MTQENSLVCPPVGWRAVIGCLSLKVTNGPMVGYSWALLSGGKLLRVLQGRYEVDQTQCFVDEIKAGDCVLDIGAHVGWYTLLSARLVGSLGKVFAFEANPRNAWYLRRHLDKNDVPAEVKAFHLGIADREGFLYFQSGTGTGTGRLAQSGEVKIPTKSVDRIVAEQQIVPTHIKIDVEGGEMAVLEGAHRTLEQHHPLLFLSTHGKGIKADCMHYLSGLGYSFETMDGQAVDAVADFICRYWNLPEESTGQ